MLKRNELNSYSTFAAKMLAWYLWMNSFYSRVETKKPVTLLKSTSFENVSQESRLFHCLFFDNVAGLDALGIASKLYTSVAKELSQKVLEANSYVYRS